MNTPKLLSRDEFREAVFTRDNHECVICGLPAVDAHHIMERRLWPDGGYYLDNGASVCEEDHLLCEKTITSVEVVREMCGIKKILVPPHLYADQRYDKWGNPILPNGQRLRGELFYDTSVQKILEQGNVLHKFVHYVKYPRTHHMPWSPGMNSDDRVIPSMNTFNGRRVILTEKMDGENTSMYRDHFHARSIDSRGHPSRSWVKAFWGRISGEIPEHWRICGENLYAVHSISYEDLPSYFLGFSIWDVRNICLSWDDTLEWFQLLGISPVPVLYDGPYDEAVIRKICRDRKWETSEGCVLRIAESFSYAYFKNSVAKYVREGHVQTNKHWMQGQPVVPNKLKV